MTSKHVLRSRALVPIALLAAFLLAGEASLRACAFRYLPRAEREVVWNRSRDASLLDAHGLYERDPREMWRLRAGATIAADETVNALGMRGEVFARGRTAGTVRIVVLGGGEALGLETPWAATWPARFAAGLESANKGLKIDIAVAACEEASIRQMLETWRARASTLEPDLVILTCDGEASSRAAPLGVTDSERIGHEIALDAATLRARMVPVSGPRVMLRVLHCAAWLWDIHTGDYWRESQARLNQERLEGAIETFDVVAARRVPFPEFKDVLRTFVKDVRDSGARIVLFPIPGSKSFAGKSDVLKLYDTLVNQVAKEDKVTLVSAHSALGSSTAGVSELYSPSGALTLRAHELMATFLVDTFRARIADIQRR